MRRKLLAAAAFAAISTSLTGNANTAVSLCTTPGCVQPNSNVLFNSNVSGNPITAQLNNVPGALVNFSSNETLFANSSGQARISGSDGNLTFLSFGLQSGLTFGEFEFNLNALANGSAMITLFSAGGETLFSSGLLNISANGQNFFGGSGAPISSVQIASSVQLGDVRQVRLGQIGTAAAVPEPATWGMLLLGFGAVGYSLRRRRSERHLAQIA
jgi:hypothetical protein